MVISGGVGNRVTLEDTDQKVEVAVIQPACV
jgi:hypothetical protein